ncbi:Ferrichrome receptor FcuA precursor [compost metagenome]
MKTLTKQTHITRRASGMTVLALAITSLFLPAHAQNKPAVLDTVDVVGTGAPAYKADSASIGPLGEKSVLNTPYAINVVPAELLENQQLKSVREAFRYMPSVQGENIRPQTRGLQAGVVQNTRIDGMNIAATTDYPIEQFDRIEVLNGLAGALYGPASPAGTFNYVLKRPTETPLRRFSVGYASQGSASVSADISDRFGEDKRYGFRVNLLDEGGESYVDRSKLDRRLASLAFDVQLTSDTKLETNISRYHYTSKGLPGTFALNNATIVFPAAPDPKRVGYGQPFAGDDNVTETYSARIKHRLNQNWNLTAGLLKQSSDRASTVPTNTLSNNAGAYGVKVATTSFSLDEILSYTLALNGRVNAAGMTHDVVVATTGFEWDRYSPYQTTNGGIAIGNSNLNNPTVFNQPANIPNFKNRYKAQTTRQQAITVGDTIGFNEQWSAGLFLSQSWIDQNGTNANGTVAPARYYKDSGLSSNATISYKPQKNMSIYASYADSLQQGDTSGTTTLAPYRSKQWELGYKLTFEKMAFGAALIQVERPFPFAAGGVYAVQGDQRNRGLELTANGALTRNLTLYGGLTYLDPKLLKTNNPATSNKQVMGLSRIVTNILLDYRIAAVPGLAVSMNVNHAGSRQGDNINSYKVDGYTVTDLGARYTTQLMGRPTTWRLAVNNVTDKRYWANIVPSGQNGYTGTDNGTGTVGAPRTIRASMQMDF